MSRRRRRRRRDYRYSLTQTTAKYAPPPPPPPPPPTAASHATAGQIRPPRRLTPITPLRPAIHDTAQQQHWDSSGSSLGRDRQPEITQEKLVGRRAGGQAGGGGMTTVRCGGRKEEMSLAFQGDDSLSSHVVARMRRGGKGSSIKMSENPSSLWNLPSALKHPPPLSGFLGSFYFCQYVDVDRQRPWHLLSEWWERLSTSILRWCCVRMRQL